ncbi:unnamed protein product, partial [Ectocarpus sp. 8 AP-2014]
YNHYPHTCHLCSPGFPINSSRFAFFAEAVLSAPPSHNHKPSKPVHVQLCIERNTQILRAALCHHFFFLNLVDLPRGEGGCVGSPSSFMSFDERDRLLPGGQQHQQQGTREAAGWWPRDYCRRKLRHRHDGRKLLPALGQATRVVVCGGIVLMVSAALLAHNLARARLSSSPQDRGIEGGVSPVVGSAATNQLLSEQQQKQQEQISSHRQPNVIFFLVDDVGTNDIGRQSTDLSELTPFLDSLSSRGVVLGNYYTNQICTPSRASLMTGRDAFRTGMQYSIIKPSVGPALG